MGKKILVIIAFMTIFFVILVSPKLFKGYKYYYGLPFIVPQGEIVFVSNRTPVDGYSAHVMKKGKILGVEAGGCPRFIRSTGEVVWEGGKPNALNISDKDIRNAKRLNFTEKLKIIDFDVSPDGKRLCFTSSMVPGDTTSKQGPYNLFVVNIDGTGLKQLTHLKNSYLRMTSHPRWSPDGKKIVFEYVTDENYRTDGSPGSSPSTSVFLMDPDNGAGMIDLIGPAGKIMGTKADPSWSTDGTRITYVSYDYDAIKEGFNVYITNADGSNLVKVTSSPYAKRQPVFSPDNKQILYVGYPQGVGTSGELFIVDLATMKEYRVTGSERVKLYPGRSSDSSPDWRAE